MMNIKNEMTKYNPMCCCILLLSLLGRLIDYLRRPKVVMPVVKYSTVSLLPDMLSGSTLFYCSFL